MSNFKNHTETAITYRLRDFSATTMLRQIRIQEYVSSKYFTLYFVSNEQNYDSLNMSGQMDAQRLKSHIPKIGK